MVIWEELFAENVRIADSSLKNGWNLVLQVTLN